MGVHEANSIHRTAETEVLLLCGRKEMDAATGRQLTELLQKKINWSEIVEQAFYHGTASLLFWNLRRLAPTLVPMSVSRQLEGAFNRIACWNLASTRELLSLLNLLGEKGIRAIPIKGPALAAYAYDNLSLRHFCDLDILISYEDVLKAKDVLQQRGYKPKLQLTAGQEQQYLRSHHDYQFNRLTDNIVVDLQWGITQWFLAFPLDFERAWQGRQTCPVAGATISSLSLDTLLLVLCVHGAKHGWEQLKWVCDIAELVDVHKENIEWANLISQARAHGGERMLLLGFSLAHNLLRARLPEEVIAAIRNDPMVWQLSQQITARLFPDTANGRQTAHELPLFLLNVRERLRDKMAVTWRNFPEFFWIAVVARSKDQASSQLPTFLMIAYYILRPCRMLWEGWMRIRRRSRINRALLSL